MHNVQFFMLSLETSVKWFLVSTPNQMLPTWKVVKWKLTNKLLPLIKKTYFTLYQTKKSIIDSESTNVFSLILLKGAG